MTHAEIRNQIEADEISIDQILVNIDESLEAGTITTVEARELEGMLNQRGPRLLSRPAPRERPGLKGCQREATS